MTQVLPRVGPALSDFSFYHQAGRAILEHRSPFTVATYDYPPLLAFLVAPFAALPYPTARLLWYLASLLCVVAAGVWTRRALGSNDTALLAVGVTWTAAGSIAVCLREGQVNAPLLALVCLALWPPRRPRGIDPWAIGAATALKVWPGILALGYLLRLRWRSLLTSAAWSLALVALPLLAVATLLAGPSLPPRAGYWMGTPAFLNSPLPAFVLRLLDPPRAGAPLPGNWVGGNNTETLHLPAGHAAISLAVALAALGVGIALLARSLRRQRHDVDPAALGSALIALALATAPIAWPHYQLLQLPGTARLGLVLATGRRRGRLAVLALAFLAVNWTEALVMGPYLAAHGTTAGSLSLVWLLSSLPTAASLVLVGLHLSSLAEPAPIPLPSS